MQHFADFPDTALDKYDFCLEQYDFFIDKYDFRLNNDDFRLDKEDFRATRSYNKYRPRIENGWDHCVKSHAFDDHSLVYRYPVWQPEMEETALQAASRWSRKRARPRKWTRPSQAKDTWLEIHATYPPLSNPAIS